jgi:hypothetical protein
VSDVDHLPWREEEIRVARISDATLFRSPVICGKATKVDSGVLYELGNIKPDRALSGQVLCMRYFQFSKNKGTEISYRGGSQFEGKVQITDLAEGGSQWRLFI